VEGVFWLRDELSRIRNPLRKISVPTWVHWSLRFRPVPSAQRLAPSATRRNATQRNATSALPDRKPEWKSRGEKAPYGSSFVRSVDNRSSLSLAVRGRCWCYIHQSHPQVIGQGGRPPISIPSLSKNP